MNKIMVALKDMPVEEALKWAELFQGKVWGFKLNTMLYRGVDPLINKMKKFGNVMADAKVFEIPDDMENTVRYLVSAGADLVTVHLTADWKPPKDLVDKVVGVTILTSFNDEMAYRVYGYENTSDGVAQTLRRAFDYGYKNVVCSAFDLRVNRIKKIISKAKFNVICPSIRMADVVVKNDDQKRTATPREAVDLGANILVIGRPIMNAEDPVSIINRINAETNGIDREPHGN